MFVSQIASACHYLHSRHIVHGNLRALYVYVESPDKVMFWFYISHECVIVFPSKYDQHARNNWQIPRKMYDIFSHTYISHQFFLDLSKTI